MPFSLPRPISMRSFQIRLLNGILLASVGFGVVLLLLGWSGVIAPPRYWSEVLISGILFMLALCTVVRAAPQYYVAVAGTMSVGVLVLFSYALLQSQANELRALWFPIGVGSTYILLGKRAGLAYTLVCLAVVLGTNSSQAAGYTRHALIVFTLAISLSSMCFYIFVSHAQRLYQHLSQREQQYRLLTDGAEEVIWRLNPDMTVAYVSPADERLRGVPAHEIIGQPIYSALGADGAQRLNKAIRSGDRLLTLPLQCKNGEVRWFEMSGRAFFDAQGRRAGYHSIGRDVTERLRLERILMEERQLLEARVQERTAALSIAKEAAEAALRTKTIFLANIGHELRTPMTLIMGMTELALSRTTEARVRPMLENAQSAARNLMVMLNDLIDLAALEARQVPFRSVPFSMHDVVASSVSLLAPKAADKGLALELVTAAALPRERHLGDADRIQQVLVNLLDNAVKFSHQGSIRVELGTQGDAADATTWTLRVIDQGIGIAAEDQPRLFTLFEQVDGSATRPFEGAGLGLALCKRMVEGMGGSLGVQSELGKGSCFWVTLPLPRAAMD